MTRNKFSNLKIYAGLALIILSSLLPSSVFANNQLFYSQNDIFFYDEDATDNCTAKGNFNSSLPAETIARLDSEGIKEKVEKEKERYLYAEKATGVPWQVIAALHYRETGLTGNYQNETILNGDPLATPGTSYINVDGQTVVDDPKQDAVNAALHFIGMAKSVYGIDPSSINISGSGTIDDWGNAFLAYNRGNYYKWANAKYDISPYVMNGYDEKHMNMSWPSISGESLSGQDSNLGALTIMAYLGDINFGSDCKSGGAVQGDIVKTALNFALDKPVSDGVTQPEQATKAYQEAIVTYNQTAAQYPEITDCGRFVSTVMRASEADPEFPIVSVTTMRDYMASSSKYEKVSNANASNYSQSLQPGDILTTSGHITLYIGDNNGYVMADASYTHRVPSVRELNCLIWMFDNNAEAWRLK